MENRIPRERLRKNVDVSTGGVVVVKSVVRWFRRNEERGYKGGSARDGDGMESSWAMMTFMKVG